MTTKKYYAENYSTGHALRGGRVQMPEDVERVCVHEPCFYCGEARGLCRHRKTA